MAIVERCDGDHVKFVDVDGIRTRYYEDGDGETLVLVHGGDYGYASSLYSWSLNFAALSERFHVIAYDKVGQGFTAAPRSDADYTWESLYRHFRGFLRAVGVRRAYLCGHSRGALPVTWMALDEPDLVQGLVIVDSSTLAPDDEAYSAGTFYEDLERRTPPGPPTVDVERMRTAANSFGSDHATDAFCQRLVEAAIQPGLQQAKQRMQVLHKTVWLPDLNRYRAEALRRIDGSGLAMPTLIVWGADDPSARLPLSYRLYDRIRARTDRASLHVFNRAGHFSFREAPEDFNRLLLSSWG